MELLKVGYLSTIISSLFEQKMELIGEIIDLTDSVGTTIINEIINLEDTITLLDQVSPNWILPEFIRLFDSRLTSVQLIEGEYIEMVGRLLSPGSEVPVSNAIIHVYDLTNRKNLTGYITHTDEYGFFTLKIPFGEYVLAATKQGYSLGWVYFQSTPDLPTLITNVFIAPLSQGNLVEKIFSPNGFMFKIYTYNKYEDPTKTKWTLEGILIVGDPYNWAKPGVTLSVDGSFEVVTPDATIDLIDLSEVGEQGFFDAGDSVERVGDNVIFFNTTMKKGDFDCFGFRLTYPKGKLPLVRLKIGTDYVFKDQPAPEPTQTDITKISYATTQNKVESSENKTKVATKAVIHRGYGKCYDETISSDDLCLSMEVKLYSQLFTKTQEALQLDLKGEYIHLFDRPFDVQILLNDSLRIGEAYIYPGFMLFNEKITLREVEAIFPPEPSIIGVVTDEEGNPVEGAKVLVYYAGTDILVAQTTSDENGFYKVDVPSEKEYDVLIIKEGLISGKTRLVVLDKDVVDDRCRAYLDSEGFVRVGDRWYYVAVLRLAEGGKIYGYVYNKKTLEPVPNVLVKAQLGQYENYAISDENGYYEILVPRGEWVVEARRTGFKPASGLRAVIQSNYRIDIYLDPATISGYVWDAVESSSTGIFKPVVGAKVKVGDSETTTDENGYFTLETSEGEQEVIIEAPRYKALKKKINVVTGGSYEFYLWKVSAYDDVSSGGRVTLKLVDSINIKGGG